MTRPDHARELRSCPCLVDGNKIGAALGLKRSPDSRQHWQCPRHGGGSLSLRRGGDGTLQVRCFGCDFAGNAFHLIAECDGLDIVDDFPAILRRAAELAGRWDLIEEMDRGPDGGKFPLTQKAAENGGRKPVRLSRVSEKNLPFLPGDSAGADLGEFTVSNGKTEVTGYAPIDEVDAVWSSALPPHHTPELASYIRGRALDPEVLWRRGLLRAVHESSPHFAWSTFGGRSWAVAGYSLIVPVFDCNGEMRGLRAWNPNPADRMPKRVAPKGCSTKGLVMACLFGRAMLRGDFAPRRVCIAEGEPDFLTWASVGDLLDERRWVTLGIESGCWTDDVAARIPDGCEVIIASHHDDAGEKYAAQIVATLSGRCSLLRREPNEAA